MRILHGVLLITAALSTAAYAANPLIDAAQANNPATLKSLLAQKSDAKAMETDGTTALHWAAHWNNLEMTNALLAAGADAAVTNRYGISPLGEAAASTYNNNSGAVVERLLKAGASANTLTTGEGETVLMTASRVGNLEAVKALLDHGANPNVKETYKGQTALMWAASQGHADVIKALLAKGADPKIYSDDRDTTLPKLPAGSPTAPISRGGFTAISFAARQGQIAATEALLDGGASINQQDVDGNSPLVLALLNKHYDLGQILINRGANVNLANKDGRSALYTIVDVRNEDDSPRPSLRDNDKATSMEVVQNLIAHHVNVNEQLKGHAELHKFAQDMGDKTMNEGGTAFMRAARSADVEVMRLLLANGADAKLAQKDGLTALAVAAGVGWAEKVRGTEANALEAVKICTEAGIDVNAKTDRGDTALHGAAMRGADTIIPYLVEHGAKLDVKNKQNLTAYDVAAGKGGIAGGGNSREPRPSTMKILQDLMAKNNNASAKNEPPKIN